MQFNIIFKTIFEYIHNNFCFVHTNTFCKYRKKLRASPRVHLVYSNHNVTHRTTTHAGYITIPPHYLKNYTPMFEHAFLPLMKDHSFEYSTSPHTDYDEVCEHNAMQLEFPHEKFSHYTTV